jgi:DNA replication and repair protein RecF
VLKKLWIKAFRNIREMTLEIPEGRPLVVVGDNNQGKSTFLEAIYSLGHGHSPLDSFEHVIAFESNESFAGGDVATSEGIHRLYVKFSKDGERKYQVDQQVYKIPKPLSKCFLVDYLSSDVIQIFKSSPDARRSDLSSFCARKEEDYGTWMHQYSRLMRQKNQTLKAGADATLIRLWNQKICEISPKIVRARLQALDLLCEKMNLLLKEGDFHIKRPVTFRYHMASLEGDFEGYQARLEAKFEEGMPKEIAAGHTLYGPHRDDFELYLADKSLFRYYSRGINRTMAVIWKVAQLLCLERVTGRLPLLLLDDPFSEVDHQIKSQLAALIQPKTQVVYTTVLEEDATLFTNATVLRMKEGQLEPFKITI